MKILVTGCAGFIGYHLVKNFLKKKSNKVYGIDNLNTYYNSNLKKDRLNILKNNKNFYFYRLDVSNKKKIDQNFSKNKYDIVFHLAAQAGVRYSFIKPSLYINTNINGFNNVIEAAYKNKIKHFVFASSSSVYGNQKKFPLNENNKYLQPESFYAVTKKINEDIAYSFSKNFNLPCTGIRFFTVYGPFGRPDMSLFKFVSNIKNYKEINLYNKGSHYRDFTYIDDVIKYLDKLMLTIPKKYIPFEIFNISSGKTIKITNFLKIIEKELDIKANKKFVDFQKGDVIKTHGDISKISDVTKYQPKIDVRKGIVKFINWYNDYFQS